MDGEPGAVSTAKEVTKLLYIAFNKFPEIFGKTSLPEADFISIDGLFHKGVKNTNPLVANIPIKASKTGFTKLAGGGLVILLGGDRPLLISALGSSQEGRFFDVEKLSAAAASLFLTQ